MSVKSVQFTVAAHISGYCATSEAARRDILRIVSMLGSEPGGASPALRSLCL
jgi:hypothetical protein